ncbi:MAG: hypothetical protein V3T81_00515 [Thermoanaerobaculia bacterium]
MHWLGWVVVALAVFEGGWFAYDGGRALVVGDYVTPTTGRFAGELGPWRHAVEAVGIEPRSTLMKSIFLGYGLAWMAVVVGFALKLHWAWWAMLAAAAGAAWYLPFGTLLSLIQIVLLLLPALRTTAASA